MYGIAIKTIYVTMAEWDRENEKITAEKSIRGMSRNTHERAISQAVMIPSFRAAITYPMCTMMTVAKTSTDRAVYWERASRKRFTERVSTNWVVPSFRDAGATRAETIRIRKTEYERICPAKACSADAACFVTMSKLTPLPMAFFICDWMN